MEKTADAVIIGGGISGASVGHFLAKKRFGKVVLLEKKKLGAVGTGHSAANVRTYYSNPVTVKFAWRAVQMFENDREELGGDSCFRQIGFLLLLGEQTVRAGSQILAMEKSNGVEGVREVSPQEIKEVAPSLNLEGIEKAIFESRSGYADPTKTTRSLVEKAKNWGLIAYEGISAIGIQLKDRRVAAVDTEQGRIESPVVVNAAGPWGRQVGLWLGLNYSLRWSRESDLVMSLPADLGPLPVVSDAHLRFYFRPNADGELLAGLGFPKEIEPLDIDNYDEALDPKTRHRIEQPLFERVPALRSARFLHGWASLYDITDDWHPLVGPEPEIEGYYAFFGGSGHCFKLGPPLGEALADLISGDKPEIDIGQLRPSRFIHGQPLSSAWGGGNRA
ncbi:MAG: FAD-binding oxidoreductase [Acidobacteria bacterium]|nr:FAD-binding oxidoreductase [Acidobacteriota bacterium]MCI0721553.1 FAD-binding oxidoreductase [Acidobacteriota bacterium]